MSNTTRFTIYSSDAERHISKQENTFTSQKKLHTEKPTRL